MIFLTADSDLMHLSRQDIAGAVGNTDDPSTSALVLMFENNDHETVRLAEPYADVARRLDGLIRLHVVMSTSAEGTVTSANRDWTLRVNLINLVAAIESDPDLILVNLNTGDSLVCRNTVDEVERGMTGSV